MCVWGSGGVGVNGDDDDDDDDLGKGLPVVLVKGVLQEDNGVLVQQA